MLVYLFIIIIIALPLSNSTQGLSLGYVRQTLSLAILDNKLSFCTFIPAISCYLSLNAFLLGLTPLASSTQLSFLDFA